MAYDFDTIARDYDRMNRLMTLGLDRLWRLSGTRAASLRKAFGTQAARLRQIRKQAACVPSGNKELDATQTTRLRQIRKQAACVPSGNKELDATQTTRLRQIRKQAACVPSGNKVLDGTQAARLRQTRKQVACVPDEYKVLDVACGTGDMCLLLAKRGFAVTGVDLSEEMLAIARRKTAGWQPVYQVADAEHLPFGDESFDAVTCAFGVRNFVHLEQGLGEMLRVLKSGGRMVILELATPDSPVIRPFYNLYARRVIPWLGQRLAGSREAYTYLPRSIERFPKGEAFCRIVEGLGAKTTGRKLTFGVCRMYVAEKA